LGVRARVAEIAPQGPAPHRRAVSAGLLSRKKPT
jgi:hypothetical protein